MSELEHAIMRNFDGLHGVQPVYVFCQFLADTKLSKVSRLAREVLFPIQGGINKMFLV